MSSFSDKIIAYFDLTKRSSTIFREVCAGVTCFLTMSYILLVNPQVLSKVGIRPTDIVVATSLSAGVGTLFVGLFGNLPCGLAPGIGLSTYLTYGLVMRDGLTKAQAFTSCFISGILLCIFSATGASNYLMKMIPKAVKVSTIVGMGLQIALLGMMSINLVVKNDSTLVSIGAMNDVHIWMALCGLVLTASLVYHHIVGAILIGIVSLSLAVWVTDKSFPTAVVQLPRIESRVSELIDFSQFDLAVMAPAIAAFLFVGVVDVSGVVFGLATLAEIPPDSAGHVPGSLSAFLGCGIGTVVGSLAGSTPVIVYVESAAGIQEGGRSGLTAVVASALFFLSLFLAPLLSSVPATATAPVSMLIGVMMMSQVVQINWNDMSEAVPAFLTLVLMPFTFSIANGILFGLAASLAFYITTGAFLRDMRRPAAYQSISVSGPDRDDLELTRPSRRTSETIVDKGIV